MKNTLGKLLLKTLVIATVGAVSGVFGGYLLQHAFDQPSIPLYFFAAFGVFGALASLASGPWNEYFRARGGVRQAIDTWRSNRRLHTKHGQGSA
ncbi:MAG: hypothetical protein Q4G30_10535 [Actinomycetaceae bacterium]|nr:hypothetical protein [Actinomycetaceae bacterium]